MHVCTWVCGDSCLTSFNPLSQFSRLGIWCPGIWCPTLCVCVCLCVRVRGGYHSPLSVFSWLYSNVFPCTYKMYGVVCLCRLHNDPVYVCMYIHMTTSCLRWHCSVQSVEELYCPICRCIMVRLLTYSYSQILEHAHVCLHSGEWG